MGFKETLWISWRIPLLILIGATCNAPAMWVGFGEGTLSQDMPLQCGSTGATTAGVSPISTDWGGGTGTPEAGRDTSAIDEDFKVAWQRWTLHRVELGLAKRAELGLAKGLSLDCSFGSAGVWPCKRALVKMCFCQKGKKETGGRSN